MRVGLVRTLRDLGVDLATIQNVLERQVTISEVAEAHAWLATHERIVVTIPISSWLARLAAGIRTVNITPAIAHTAVTLPATFPGDPADRLIYATAVELSWCLVSKDRRLREHPTHGRSPSGEQP